MRTPPPAHPPRWRPAMPSRIPSPPSSHLVDRLPASSLERELARPLADSSPPSIPPVANSHEATLGADKVSTVEESSQEMAEQPSAHPEPTTTAAQAPRLQFSNPDAAAIFADMSAEETQKFLMRVEAISNLPPGDVSLLFGAAPQPQALPPETPVSPTVFHTPPPTSPIPNWDSHTTMSDHPSLRIDEGARAERDDEVVSHHSASERHHINVQNGNGEAEAEERLEEVAGYVEAGDAPFDCDHQARYPTCSPANSISGDGVHDDLPRPLFDPAPPSPLASLTSGDETPYVPSEAESDDLRVVSIPGTPTYQPEVIDLANSDDEGRISAIQDRWAVAAAQRLGRTACEAIISARFDDSIYRVLRGRTVDIPSPGKRAKKAKTRRVGDTGDYNDVALYLQIDVARKMDIVTFDNWLCQYLRLGHSIRMVMERAFPSKRNLYAARSVSPLPEPEGPVTTTRRRVELSPSLETSHPSRDHRRDESRARAPFSSQPGQPRPGNRPRHAAESTPNHHDARSSRIALSRIGSEGQSQFDPFENLGHARSIHYPRPRPKSVRSVPDTHLPHHKRPDHPAHEERYRASSSATHQCSRKRYRAE